MKKQQHLDWIVIYGVKQICGTGSLESKFSSEKMSESIRQDSLWSLEMLLVAQMWEVFSNINTRLGSKGLIGWFTKGDAKSSQKMRRFIYYNTEDDKKVLKVSLKKSLNLFHH